MLEQWEADALLAVEKVYSATTVVDLTLGADADYRVEAFDESSSFILDVRRATRNPTKATYQLRYRRDIVLARLCTSVRHTNPDAAVVEPPHLHLYRQGDADKWAVPLEQGSLDDLLRQFCKQVNLPEPDIQGGVL
jgi:hypothetical protein